LRAAISLSLLLTVGSFCCARASAQFDTLDTHERLFALRDSLVTWVEHPPLDTLRFSGMSDLRDYFPGMAVRWGIDSSFAIEFPPYLEMRWGTLRGSLAGSSSGRDSIAWSTRHTGRKPALSDRLTWLRTSPLPKDVRAPAPGGIDTVRFVLHGRDVDSIAMSFSAAEAVLAWMTRGRQVLVAPLGDTDTLTGHPASESHELFMLIVPPGVQGHHALRWREIFSDSGESDPETRHSVTVYLYPFIPTGNVIELFAEPDTTARYYEPVPVREGVER